MYGGLMRTACSLTWRKHQWVGEWADSLSHTDSAQLQPGIDLWLTGPTYCPRDTDHWSLGRKRLRLGRRNTKPRKHVWCFRKPTFLNLVTLVTKVWWPSWVWISQKDRGFRPYGEVWKGLTYLLCKKRIVLFYFTDFACIFKKTGEKLQKTNLHVYWKRTWKLWLCNCK